MKNKKKTILKKKVHYVTHLKTLKKIKHKKKLQKKKPQKKIYEKYVK